MQDVAIQPHNNLHFIRIVQEGEGKCSNNGMKEFGEGMEKECCWNCNWIRAKYVALQSLVNIHC